METMRGNTARYRGRPDHLIMHCGHELADNRFRIIQAAAYLKRIVNAMTAVLALHRVSDVRVHGDIFYVERWQFLLRVTRRRGF
jgi:hypothetical protein